MLYLCYSNNVPVFVGDFAIYCWGRVYTNIFTKKYWSDGFYYLYTYSIELASSPLGYAPWLIFLFKSTLQPIRILLTCIVISVGFLKDCWLNSHSPCPRIAKELDKQAPMRDHKSQITLLNRNKNAQVLPNELTWIKFVAAYETESETPASTAVSEGFFLLFLGTEWTQIHKHCGLQRYSAALDAVSQTQQKQQHKYWIARSPADVH